MGALERSPTGHLAPRIEPAQIVALARGWLGTPYHHQASLRGVGTDCIGLVRGIWRELYGEEPEPIPAYSGDWAEATGTETLLAAATRHLQPTACAPTTGDVVIFRLRPGVVAKHTGIITGPCSFIHAMEGGPVCEVALAGWWRRRIVGTFRFPGVIDLWRP